MITATETGPVHLSVVRPGRGSAVGAASGGLLADGTAAIGGGTLLVGAVLVEAIRFVTGESGARWWYALLAIAGVGLVVIGGLQRRLVRRRMRVGVAISALDPRRGSRGQFLVEQAETHATTTCQVALAVNTDLTGDLVADLPTIQRLADFTTAALMLAERLTPDASRVNLIPTMPLNIAFWLGARLGHTHSREIGVHQIKQGDGRQRYFLATTLRDIESKEPPPSLLAVGDPVLVDSVDSTRIALAVDLMAKGARFMDPVMAACRAAGIGKVIPVRNPSRFLTEDRATFSAAVEQISRVWREAKLPPGVAAGQHVIFLDGPVAIALTLGARLAAAQPGAWTAYTLDPDKGICEPFPPVTEK